MLPEQALGELKIKIQREKRELVRIKSFSFPLSSKSKTNVLAILAKINKNIAILLNNVKWVDQQKKHDHLHLNQTENCLRVVETLIERAISEKDNLLLNIKKAIAIIEYIQTNEWPTSFCPVLDILNMKES